MVSESTKAALKTPRKRATNAHKAPEIRQRSAGNTAAVQQYLEANPGGHVWASDIMTATGLTKGQVQQSIGYLRSVVGMTNIVIIRPGNAWRYLPTSGPMSGEVPVSLPAARAPEPEWGPEHNVPSGPQAAPEISRPVLPAVVAAVLPGGQLILTINETTYHAKPLS